MGIARVDKCCCCNLETGCTVLGVLSLIGGIISLIGGGSIVGKQGGTGADYLISGILAVIIGICAIIAVRKANPTLLIPYLIVDGIGIIKYVIFAIWDVCRAIGGSKNVSGGALAVGIIIYVLVACLLIYFWIVVYSLYKKLKEGTSIRNTSSTA